MRIITSPTLQARWDANSLARQIARVELDAPLRALVEAPLVRHAGALVLQPLVEATRTSRDAYTDATAFEAAINSFRVEELVARHEQSDRNELGEPREPNERSERNQSTQTSPSDAELLQAISAAMRLTVRLESLGKYRVLLTHVPASSAASVGMPSTRICFFERRAGESFGPENLADVTTQEVLFIDTQRINGARRGASATLSGR